MSTPTPLSFDLNTADAKTTLPAFNPTDYVQWRFTGVKETPNENGNVLTFEFDLAAPAATVDGGVLKPGDFGAKHFHRVFLYAKDTPKGVIPERAKQDIAKLQDALLGTGDVGNAKGKPVRPAFNGNTVGSMVGSVLYAKMKVDGEYGNKFGHLMFPGDMPTAS